VGKKKNNSNLNFIANYLFANPYSSSTIVRRALCKHVGAIYTRGHYTEYFRIDTNSKWHCSTLPKGDSTWKAGYGSVLWRRVYINSKPKWILTVKGMEYVSQYQKEG